MARYFFNVHDAIGFAEDEEGRDLHDVEAARNEAIKGARSIINDEISTRGLIDLTGRIDVVDQMGTLLFTLPFREAVQLRTDDQRG